MKGEILNNSKEERKYWVPGSLSVLLCMLGFSLVIILGLKAADSSFNNFTGRKNNVTIFAFHENGIGRYNIDFFGKRQEFDTEKIWQMIESTKHLIKSVFNEENGS